VCGCPNGQERFGGSCEALYTQSVCGQGQVLLPDNFNIGQKSCPGKFSCQVSNKCRAFQEMKTELAPTGTIRRNEQQTYLKEMICKKKSRSVCCPDYDRDSLFSPDILLASMVPPQAACANNPCLPGKWPWVGKDGSYKCLYRENNVEHCRGNIIEEDGWLICDILDVKSAARIFSQNCGRRRRWKCGRCVRIF
jgi:hypothetical protein